MALSTHTRVLLVEKDRIVRELLEVTLARAERRIEAVSTVAEALDLATSQPPIDVALVESSLSDGSGLELVQRLKTLDSTTEVLLMSAAPSLEAVLAAVEAGATEYFPKPFEDINQLILRIGAAEERSHLRREGKWLHNALVESEERYRKLFAATPDALIVFDERSKRIEDANLAALALYGYERDELLGRCADELRAPTSQDPPSSMDASALDSLGNSGVLRRREARRDGSTVEVELVVGHFHIKGQTKVVEIIRDIDERLLQQRVRTELEDQLRQSQKLEALGRLAGGVAHDFNNLLAVILNYGQFVSENLKRLPANELIAVLLDDVEQILKASTSATSLTRQLLAFSRRELVQPEVLEINSVVSATERLLHGTIGPNITLHTHLAPNVGRVRIDRGQLEQVLVNLVVNARDAMPRGGHLTIATRVMTSVPPHDAGTAMELGGVQIDVIDTGDGIDASILDKIFEPFFTTKARDRGTGLGLAMVKGIVEHAGGKLDVATELGKGTRFRITLPVTTDSIENKPRSTAPSHRPTNGESILVVDDDVGVRKALCRILRSAGYGVVTAENGDRALAEHQRLGARFDLVITDILMPGQSGEELVAQLRCRQPDLKTIFVTGYATMPVVERGQEREQRAVLPKPFDQRRLLAIVREVLDFGDEPLHDDECHSAGEHP